MNFLKAQAAAVAAARAAGRIMRQNLNAAKKVDAETSHDIKLELDVRCQRLIERKLYRAFPAIAFLGEEGSHRTAGADFRWVVDPIDGTVNFAHELPHASVSIALQQKVSRLRYATARQAGVRYQVSGGERRPPARRGIGTNDGEYETIVGVVYDPFQDELWTAIRGGAARLNGRIIHASGRRRLKVCMVSIGFAKSRDSLEAALPYFAWLARRVRKIRMLGSAALGLAYVATGRLDAYVERGVSLWDVAAGGLIVECAGGKFWTEPIRGRHRVRMISSNGLVHDQLPVPK